MMAERILQDYILDRKHSIFFAFLVIYSMHNKVHMAAGYSSLNFHICAPMYLPPDQDTEHFHHHREFLLPSTGLEKRTQDGLKSSPDRSGYLLCEMSNLFNLFPHRQIGTNDTVTYHERRLRSNKIMDVTVL